ncbi:type II toxin-antitoxin system ParD family antitoxin [Methylobacterium sp. E-041]|uniref:type II toxin-antitoxin system ParD family antitoxin n=1 Tax=Methylobacterium sp. E-041 TaxID=2836573 RepID=UPI0028BD2DF8|nr:type II toxin-antitoxin system ParD family antitoxin [Methylobacterium sp. E-041]
MPQGPDLSSSRQSAGSGGIGLVRSLRTPHSIPMAMPVRRTLTVSITQEQDALVRACIQSGRFASASEVVRAALRLLDRDETVMRRDRSNAAPKSNVRA